MNRFFKSKNLFLTGLLSFCINLTFIFVLSGNASGADLINEDFEGSGTPTGWINNSVDWSTTYANSPTHSELFGAAADYLITPLLTNPDTMTYYMRATAGVSSFIIEQSTSTDGPWTGLTESPTTTDYNATFIQETFDLSSYTNIYIKFRRNSTKSYYMDDVVVTESVAQSVTVDSIADGTNTITTYDGTGHLLDADATVNMTLVATPSAAPVLWFDVGAAPTNGSPSRSATATGSGTSWSAVIPASDSEIVDGALVEFLVNVDGTNYYLTGTTPWKYTVDGTAPTVSSASYNAQTDKLTINFNESVKFDAITITGIKIDYDNDGVVDLTLGTSDAVDNIADSSTITLSLVTSASTIEAWTDAQKEGMELELDAGAFKDTVGNNIVAIDHTADKAITYYGLHSYVKINELFYDSETPTVDDGYEWIELVNTGSFSVDLGGWTIEWGGAAFTDTYTIPAGNTIQGKNYFLIAGSNFNAADGWPDITPDISTAAFTFQNGGTATDGVRINNGSGYTDTCLYDTPNTTNLLPDDDTPAGETTNFAADVAGDHSLTRDANHTDTDNCASDFSDSATPTPKPSDSIRQLDIVTAEQSFAVNVCSAVYSVWTKNAAGTGTPPGWADVTINLTSTSGAGGVFYSVYGEPWTEITNITIVSNVYEGIFYYKDDTASTPTYTITAAESPDYYWTDATQAVTITGGSNERPSVTIDQVDNDASYSGKWFGNKDIEIDYTLTDAESDTCSIDIEYSLDSTNGTDGTWTDCTDAGGTSDGKTSLASSSGGTAHDFLWDADGQLSTTEDSVIWVRITPSDAGGAGTTVPSSSFGLDNVAPSTAAISSVDDADAEIYEDGTFTKIYYNSTPVTASGFTIVVDAADGGSGLDKCSFSTKFSDGGDDTTEAAAPNVYTSADSGNVYEVEQTSSDAGDITITVYDVVGNTATDTIAVEQDNVAPTATLALDADTATIGYAPNTGYYDDSSADVTVSDAADGGSGLPTDCYKWKKDAGEYGAYGSSNTHTFISLADGDYTLYSMVKDNVNNTWEDSVTVTVDTSNPVGHIDLVEASDGLYISDGTDITVGTLYYKNNTATSSYHFETADADVTWDNSAAWKVVFDAEWGETENEDTATPYASSTYNISIDESPAAGTHWVRLVNNAGNYQEISITLTLDVADPSIDSGSWGDDSNYLYSSGTSLYFSNLMGASSQTASLSGTASDDGGAGLWKMTFSSEASLNSSPGDDTSPASWSGDYTVVEASTAVNSPATVTLYDNVGNTATANYNYYEDTTAPSIDTGEWSEPVASDYFYPSTTNLYFSDGMGVTVVTARLSGTASDTSGSGLQKMTFSSEASLLSSPGDDATPATWSGDYTVDSTSAGTNSPATVTLYDNVGNTATANYNYYEDTTAPTGAGCSDPADNDTGISITPTLTAQAASDSIPISYYFLLSTDSGFSGGLQNSGWQSEDTTWVPPSALNSSTDYWWKVNAKDAVGNESGYGTAYKFTTVAKDIRINSVAPSETNDWIEFYVTAGGNFNGYKVYEGATLVKTFPTFTSNPATGDYIVLHAEAGTDETSGKGTTNPTWWDLYGMGALTATDNTITLKDASDNIKDFVAWANQDGTWGSAHVTAADAAVTAGQWTKLGTNAIQFDCGPSEFVAGDTIGRDASSTDNNSKSDWSYKAASLDTQGGVNGASTTIQGHGTASISPENATAGSTGTFTITYTNDSLADDTTRHLITIDVPDGWTAPQTTTATAAGYIVPNSINATYLISTSGQKIIVPVRNMTDGASVDIIYGDTQSGANPGAVATVGSTGGTNTFTVSSDDTGKNVSEIDISPGVDVSTETTISITNWRELY